MKKKIILLALALGFTMLGNNIVFAQDNVPTVIIDSIQVAYDQKPVIQNGRVLVPMRATFEALGADIIWNDITKTVDTSSSNGKDIRITIGSNEMKVDKEKIWLDVPAKIINSRTLIPLRAVSEAFDANVEWNEEKRTVYIKTIGSISMTDESEQVIDNEKSYEKTKGYTADDGELVYSTGYSYDKILSHADEKIKNKIYETISKRGQKSCDDALSPIENNGALTFIDVAREEYEEKKLNEEKFEPYITDVSFKIKYQDENIVSYLCTDYTYTGGNHPNGIIEGMTFNLKTGELMDINDVTTFNKEEIKAFEIVKFSEEIKNKPEEYFTDALDTLAESIDRTTFYIDEGGLKIAFMYTYDIAPYSTGYPTITVDYTGNESIFKIEIKKNSIANINTANEIQENVNTEK